MLKTITRITALFSVLLIAGAANAAEFAVQPGISSVSFTSNALLETITGTSASVSGSVTVDVADASTATGSVSFPTSSLVTGIDMRDQHLHGGDWLNAEANPNITFALTSVAASGALTHGATVSGTVTGDLTIAGTTQTVTAPVDVTFYQIDNPEVAGTYGIDSDILRITSSFDIQLSDYGVVIIQPMQTKVSNTLNLNIRLTATQQ